MGDIKGDTRSLDYGSWVTDMYIHLILFFEPSFRPKLHESGSSCHRQLMAQFPIEHNY